MRCLLGKGDGNKMKIRGKDGIDTRKIVDIFADEEERPNVPMMRQTYLLFLDLVSSSKTPIVAQLASRCAHGLRPRLTNREALP
jgi:hypothetical protein